MPEVSLGTSGRLPAINGKLLVLQHEVQHQDYREEEKYCQCDDQRPQRHRWWYGGVDFWSLWRLGCLYFGHRRCLRHLRHGRGRSRRNFGHRGSRELSPACSSGRRFTGFPLLGGRWSRTRNDLSVRTRCTWCFDGDWHRLGSGVHECACSSISRHGTWPRSNRSFDRHTRGRRDRRCRKAWNHHRGGRRGEERIRRRSGVHWLHSVLGLNCWRHDAALRRCGWIMRRLGSLEVLEQSRKTWARGARRG